MGWMPDRLKIISVNIGGPEKIGGPGTPKFYPVKTGIRKVPVVSPVKIGPLGLEGDFIGNKKHHGGVDQAVYIYSREDYAFWEEQLGKPCPPGLFGENLTVEGMESAHVCVGDRYHFEDIILEVTGPRIPCSTFAAHMNDRKFVKIFMSAKRPGMYCRVVQGGNLEAGMSGTIGKFGGEAVTMLELFEAYPFKTINDKTRQRYLAIPGHQKLMAYLKGETGSL